MPRQPVEPDVDPYDDPDEPEESAVVVAPTPTPEQAVPLSTIEVLLEEHAEADDVWAYVDEIRERNVPMEFRQQFYQRWIAMVATRPMSERDALIAHGQPVFKYRTETARQDVEQKAQSGASRSVVKPSVITDSFIAEMIWCPDDSPAVRYLVWKASDGTTEIQDSVPEQGAIYSLPLIDSLLGAKPALMLPTGVENYGDTAALHDDLCAFIREWVKLKSEVDVQLSARYCRYTWVADKIPVAPYYHAAGDFEAGKSRLLDVIGAVVRHGLFASGSLTSAVIYRALGLVSATLVVDEADYDKNDPQWKEMVKVFLTGSTDLRPVLRVDMDSRGAIRTFDPFGPKILASRKGFPNPALQSRCLDFEMMPNRLKGAEREAMAKILPPKFYKDAQTLRNKLLRWRIDHVRNIVIDHYANFEGLSMRVTQAAIALQAACGEGEGLDATIMDRLRGKTEDIQLSRGESEEGVIANALLERWRKLSKPPKVPLQQVVEYLGSPIGAGWKDVKAKDVAEMIRKTLQLTCKPGNGQPNQIHLSPKQAARLEALYTNGTGGPNARVTRREPVR